MEHTNTATDGAKAITEQHDFYYFAKVWHVIGEYRNTYSATFRCGVVYLGRESSLSSRVALRNDIAESGRPLCPGCLTALGVQP